jgi:hypothetical protein
MFDKTGHFQKPPLTPLVLTPFFLCYDLLRNSSRFIDTRQTACDFENAISENQMLLENYLGIEVFFRDRPNMEHHTKSVQQEFLAAAICPHHRCTCAATHIP